MNRNNSISIRKLISIMLLVTSLLAIGSIINCSDNNPLSEEQTNNTDDSYDINDDYDISDDDDDDYSIEEIPVPGKYRGTAKITVVYGLSSNGNPFATKNYTHPVDVFIKKPVSISLTNLKETNDLNIEMRTLPDVVLNKYAGSFYICSATSAAPGANPNLSTNLLFQFWNLQIDGTSIEGTIKNTYKSYNPVVFANFFTIETVSGTPRYLSRYLESVSVMSGTIDDEDAEIEVIGGVEGGMPDYVCVFKIIISAKRVY